MAKRPQSGDIDIHFDRIKCIDSLQKVEEGAISVAQCPDTYRNWPNGRRVATSTWRLPAYLRLLLHPRIRVISNRGQGESPAEPPARPRGEAEVAREAAAREAPGRSRSKPEQEAASKQQAGR